MRLYLHPSKDVLHLLSVFGHLHPLLLDDQDLPLRLLLVLHQPLLVPHNL